MSAAGAPLPGPGGLRLLSRALALAALPARARLLDVGCGSGEAVRFMRDTLGLRAIGLDRACPEGRPGPAPWLRAEGARLPIADGAMDAVLLSCVLSAAGAPAAILAECSRVLVRGGRLLVLDLFARAPGRGAVAPESAPPPGWPRAPGFEVVAWEDHSAVLGEYVARYVLEQGPLSELRQRLSASGAPCAPAGGRPPRLGYGLSIARRDQDG